MREWLVAAVLMATVLGVLGCGKSDPQRTGRETPAAASPIQHRPEDVQSLVLPEEVSGVVESWSGDLDGMIDRKLVRVAVARGGFFFYIHEGRQYGLTSEALRGFEEFLNTHLGLKGTKRVHVVALPMTRDQIFPAVAEGIADIAAGGLTITPERRRLLDFSAPWMTGVREIVVTGPVSLPIDSLDDLSGREVVVRVSSSYYESLLALNADLEARGRAPMEIVPAHEIFEDEDLLEMVSVGMIGITVSDDYVARFWAQVFADLSLRPDLVVRESGDIAWGFRKDSPRLRDAVNLFVEKNRPGTLLGNVVSRRYLDDPQRVVNALAGDRLDLLSFEAPYFRKYAELYGFDWLQLAAQAFQESRLDHETRSPAGAVGIMQVMPQTGRLMRVKDYASLEGNIHAGARYMRYLADHYFPDEDMDPMNRWLFALAGYNAGGARISRLREKARKNGRDPQRWFGQVENEVAARVGSETVNYVRNVMKYYLAYRMTFEREQLREDVLSRLARAD
jgi:membrane-bound lytic murein transglycosylase MltF